MKNQISHRALVGIVACGGASSRMGEDKSLINYHGIEQHYYMYRMLEQFCTDVFLSCNAKQSSFILLSYQHIIDEESLLTHGPIVSLLSANKKIKDASFLLVGCDYPFITSNHIQKLVETWKRKKQSVCYYNELSGFEEPLLAIYDEATIPLLPQLFAEKKYSLRHFLKDTHATHLIPSDVEAISSIDTQEEMLNAKNKIKNQE